MNIFGQMNTLLVLLCLTLPSLAQQSSAITGNVEQISPLNLEGKSFQGIIKAKGLAGLFGVEGVLSFKDGLLIWSAKGSQESASYKIEKIDGVLYFTSRVLAVNGTYVDWSGSYDGESLINVTATWTRIEEDDFIHNLLLPDVVTLTFKPVKK